MKFIELLTLHLIVATIYCLFDKLTRAFSQHNKATIICSNIQFLYMMVDKFDFAIAYILISL